MTWTFHDTDRAALGWEDDRFPDLEVEPLKPAV